MDNLAMIKKEISIKFPLWQILSLEIVNTVNGGTSVKATGIVRRIDDLGRVVVPKEIRRVLRIREGDPLEIYTGTTGEVILKKYSPIQELGSFAGEYAETASKVLGGTVIVSDTDHIIAASGPSRKEYSEKKVDGELDRIIQSKNRYLNDSKIVVPIVSQGDPIGSVTILPKGSKPLGDSDLKVAEIGAFFLARQMES
jgi:AbrB family transcriptional regulator (stage V sporulation protein T)